MPRQNKSKKGKRPDKRPARTRYWTHKSLEKNKVRHLVKRCGMPEATARKYWLSQRRTRVHEGCPSRARMM